MARKKSWNIAEMGYTDVQEYLKKNDTIIVSMGSTEKHGAHCPLGTDSFTAMGVIERAAELSETFYTPLVPVGYSPHHMGRMKEGCGTLTFSADTYRSVVYDLAMSLVYHGFNKIVFVTHHGSNSKVIDDVLRRIRYETGCFVCWYKTPTERTYSLLGDIVDGPPEETPGWHAGEIETSTAWAYKEGTIDMDLAVKDKTHPPAYMGKNFTKKDGTGFVAFQGAENIWVPMDHYEYSDSATIGNPKNATVELGEALIKRMASHLAEFATSVRDIPTSIHDRDWPERAY